MRMDYKYDPNFGVEDPQFLRGLQALHTGLRPGNTVALLENGDGLFPALLGDLRKAQQSINIELYIFSQGKVAQDVVDILCERARAGVEVRVLVDGLGARLGELEAAMTAAGVRLRVYKPLKIYALNTLEERTHRKIVNIDGRICYCGGFGFDDRWLGRGSQPDEWRDLAVRVEGPTVAQMQYIFQEDWLQTTGEVLSGDRQFPSIPLTGEVMVQAIGSARTEQVSMAKLMVYMAIQAARKRIWIANAYFVPDAQIRRALIRAVQRGVDVRVVVPGKNMDIPYVWRASRYYQADLLKGGVKVFEFEPSMLHTKAMVVDGVWTTIGSINFSSRSFKKNAEANVGIYDYDFAAKVEEAISDDMSRSEVISLSDTKKRGMCEKLKEFWSSLFSEQF